MSIESVSVEYTSVDSGDFIFVGKCRQDDSKAASTMDLNGLNEEEASLVKKIRKLISENEALKRSLMNHNGLIQEYCDELEKLQKNQKIEKENTHAIMESLKRENMHLASMQTTASKPSISDSICFQNMSSTLDLLEKISEKLKKIKIKFKPMKKGEESLPYPVQESQATVDCIDSFSQCMENLKYSISQHPFIESHFEEDALAKQVHEKDIIIANLKSDLSERMEDTENLLALQDKFKKSQDSCTKLTGDIEKLKRIINQQKTKIEQLECEQPSVEIMHIPSPKQTKMIEDLNAELQKANSEIVELQRDNFYLENRVKDLNRIKTDLLHDASQQSKVDSLEINEIRNSYDIAMEGLKEEVSSLKEKNTSLDESMKEHLQKQSSMTQEINSLKRTLDLMRKRENKDMDKLNAMTIERDELSSNLQKKQRTIEDLVAKMDADVQHLEREESSLTNEQFQMVSHDDKVLSNLRNEVIAHEQTIRILREENFKLKDSLTKDVQICNSCKHTEENIDKLVQENENLYAKLRGYSSMENMLKKEKARCEQLAADKQALSFEIKKVELESDMRDKHRKGESENISALKQKIDKYEKDIIQYRQVLQDYRQSIEAFQANEKKLKRELDNMWSELQTKVNQITQVDEQKNALSMRANQFEEVLKAEVEKRSKLESYLQAREMELKQLHDELETVALLREQVKVYESDFNMERDAREKQHGDILILRDEVHNLKLENHRLREEVETVNQHQMVELQRRYGVGSQVNRRNNDQNSFGLYGRGGTVPDNRRNLNSTRSNDSLNRSGEVLPQEADQTVQRLCPKCHAPFPDLDTLQIHVLECIDE